MSVRKLRRNAGFSALLSLVLLLACLAVSGTALAGGNSDSAKLCQDWPELIDTSGAPFTNQGECVSYAAHGGSIYAVAGIEVSLCANQPADGICVETSGFGLEPGTLMTTTVTKNEAFLEFHAVFVQADGSASDSFGHISAPCVAGNVYSATATGTSAAALNTGEPGIPITSNTVSRTSSCP